MRALDRKTKTMNRLIPLIAVALPLAFALPVAAQQGNPHAGHGAPAAAGGQNASTEAFKAAAAKMHKSMETESTGDADIDFVRGMIPHHQGAIDMAKVALEHGKDPEIRKLAEGVVREQEKEIAEMRAWLKAKGK